MKHEMKVIYRYILIYGDEVACDENIIRTFRHNITMIYYCWDEIGE